MGNKYFHSFSKLTSMSKTNLQSFERLEFVKYSKFLILFIFFQNVYETFLFQTQHDSGHNKSQARIQDINNWLSLEKKKHLTQKINGRCRQTAWFQRNLKLTYYQFFFVFLTTSGCQMLRGQMWKCQQCHIYLDHNHDKNNNLNAFSEMQTSMTSCSISKQIIIQNLNYFHLCPDFVPIVSKIF